MIFQINELRSANLNLILNLSKIHKIIFCFFVCNFGYIAIFLRRCYFCGLIHAF